MRRTSHRPRMRGLARETPPASVRWRETMAGRLWLGLIMWCAVMLGAALAAFAGLLGAAVWGGAVSLLAVALGLLACVAVSRGTTRPLMRLAHTVRGMAAGDLVLRAAVTGPADLREVALSVNALAEECGLQRARDAEDRRLSSAAREAGIRIRAHLDLSEVLTETVAAIEGFVPNDAAYLHLVRDGRVELPVAHEHEWILPPEFTELPTEVVHVMADLLARHSSQVLQDLNGPDAASVPPRHLAMLRVAGIVSMLVTPFGSDSELDGMITALRKRPGQPWTPAEIDAFQQIAADIGRALKHARQFEAENRLVDELKALDRRKSTFIATVSHELRTPLTSIVGYTEILADTEAGPLTPDQEQMVDTIRRNATRLRNLVEDLLTLSKIESGAFRTSMRPVSLADVITAAMAALEPSAAAAGLTLTSALPRHRVMVSGDPSQLDRLLMNLLSNAVKFTPRGGRIEVTVGGGHGTAVITVTDTGIGIPEAERHLVSTRFFRAANAVKRAIPGTGLGLAIAGTIVANHGGELTIDSAEGQGTTVTVRIPQLPVIPAASHRRRASQASEAHS